jgi:hypothetical protein
MRRRASLAGADEDEGLKGNMRSNVEEVDSDDTKDNSPSPDSPKRSLSREKENDNSEPTPAPIPAPLADSKMEDYYRKQRQRARLRSPWSCSLVTMICTGLSLLLLATIAQSFLGRQLDDKGCNMSYMLSAFAKYTDFDTEHTRFATKYSLYLYREAGIDQDTRVRIRYGTVNNNRRLTLHTGQGYSRPVHPRQRRQLQASAFSSSRSRQLLPRRTATRPASPARRQASLRLLLGRLQRRHYRFPRPDTPGPSRIPK